jgi:hypothetical protein
VIALGSLAVGRPLLLAKKYPFLYRRRSFYFYVLSSLAGRLTAEMTRTSTIEQSIRRSFSTFEGELPRFIPRRFARARHSDDRLHRR